MPPTDATPAEASKAVSRETQHEHTENSDSTSHKKHSSVYTGATEDRWSCDRSSAATPASERRWSMAEDATGEGDDGPQKLTEVAE